MPKTTAEQIVIAAIIVIIIMIAALEIYYPNGYAIIQQLIIDYIVRVTLGK